MTDAVPEYTVLPRASSYINPRSMGKMMLRMVKALKQGKRHGKVGRVGRGAGKKSVRGLVTLKGK